MKGYKWVKKPIIGDKLYSWKFFSKRASGYDYCLSYFYVWEDRIDEIRFWDVEECTFVLDETSGLFENKTAEEAKLYVETILRLEGTI